MNTPTLLSNTISQEYKELCKSLHVDDPSWGVASVTMAPHAANIINNHGFTDILDYGAGKCRMSEALAPLMQHAITITNYDPGMPEIDEVPSPHEFVICVDVLEHIEPEYLDSVIDDLVRVTKVAGFFTIHCGPAKRVLADGRNAHLIQESPLWWLTKLDEHFEMPFVTVKNHSVIILAKPKKVAIQS